MSIICVLMPWVKDDCDVELGAWKPKVRSNIVYHRLGTFARWADSSVISTDAQCSQTP
jgi:hypothetical protein